MKIECLLKRDGGSIVTLGSKSYHFAPDDAGRHVADVEAEAHVERLLSITEGYRLVAGEAANPPKQTPATVTGLSTLSPVSFPAGIPEDDPTGAAAREAAIQAAKEKAAQYAQEQEATKAAAPAKSEPPKVDDLEAAKAAHIEKFGKKPHHTWSADVIRKKIAEG